MKDFYYFSKNKLKFVEIRNFKRKFVFLVIFFSLMSSFLIFGSYYILNQFLNSDSQVKSLQLENKQLGDKLTSVLQKYQNFDARLDSLIKENNYLRLAVNLKPINIKGRENSIGGGLFGEIPITSSDYINKVVNSLDKYVRKISTQMKLTKTNYVQIKKTLTLNKKLYADLPAIKPTNGPYGDGFGMRLHPILKIWRMHNGIDILVDIGTPVYATGGGVVSFVGREGGYGLTVKIDHGFGYTTLYGHLKRILVRKNQKVVRGQKIALSGNTGLSTGPHLHYEVRHDGIALNPRNFIFDNVNLFEIVKK